MVIIALILGYQLAFRESEILLRILAEVNGEGIVALPIHDALMVPQSQVSIAKQKMSLVTVSMENIQRNTLALVEILLADQGQRPLDSKEPIGILKKYL